MKNDKIYGGLIKRPAFEAKREEKTSSFLKRLFGAPSPQPWLRAPLRRERELFVPADVPA
ncbi:MAG: hypothetical protein QM805_07540 [Pseudomonas sp.]